MPLQVMDLTQLSSSKHLPVYLKKEPPPPFKLPDKSPWTLSPSSNSGCHPSGVIARQRLLGNDNSSSCRQTRNQRHPVPDLVFVENHVGRRNQHIGVNAIDIVATNNNNNINAGVNVNNNTSLYSTSHHQHSADIFDAYVSKNSTISGHHGHQRYNVEKAVRCNQVLRGDVEPKREFLRPQERSRKPVHDNLFELSMFAPSLPPSFFSSSSSPSMATAKSPTAKLQSLSRSSTSSDNNNNSSSSAKVLIANNHHFANLNSFMIAE